MVTLCAKVVQFVRALVGSAAWTHAAPGGSTLYSLVAQLVRASNS